MKLVKTGIDRDGARTARRSTVAVAAVLALLVSGCSSDGKDDGAKATGAATTQAAGTGVAEAKAAVDQALAPPTAITQTTPLPSAPPKTGSVIFMANPLPATQLIGGGIKKAAEAIGWSFSQITYDAANPATLQAAFRSALAKKPSVVVTSGIAQKLYGESIIADYAKAKIPIVQGVACPAEQSGSVVLGPNGCEFEEVGGKLFADWFVADSNGKGKAVLSDVTAYPSYASFNQAFKDEVAATCPDCRIKSIEITADQLNKGQVVPTMISALRSSPEFKYAVFDNGAFTKGFDAALQAAGLKNIIAGGRAIDEGALADLKAGSSGAWTASSYPLVGFASLDAALRSLMGVGGLEGNFALPIQLLTKDNASEAGSPYNAPADGLAQYLKLWQLTS